MFLTEAWGSRRCKKMGRSRCCSLGRGCQWRDRGAGCHCSVTIGFKTGGRPSSMTVSRAPVLRAGRPLRACGMRSLSFSLLCRRSRRGRGHRRTQLAPEPRGRAAGKAAARRTRGFDQLATSQPRGQPGGQLRRLLHDLAKKVWTVGLDREMKSALYDIVHPPKSANKAEPIP